MEKNSRIFVAGHRGLVGSAIWKSLEERGYSNLIGTGPGGPGGRAGIL